jgi:hypothetical protein
MLQQNHQGDSTKILYKVNLFYAECCQYSIFNDANLAQIIFYDLPYSDDIKILMLKQFCER